MAMASYDVELSREQSEPQQVHAVVKTPIVLYIQEIQLLIGGSSSLEHPQLPHFKEEEEDPQHLCINEEDPQPPRYIKKEEEHPQPLHVKEEEEEEDFSTFTLTGVSAKSEEGEDQDPPEQSQLHHHISSGDHCGGPPPDKLIAPLSHSDDTNASDTDCEGDDKHLKKETINKKTTQTHKRCHAHEEDLTCSVCGKRDTSMRPPH
ncbi:uncharacterized protein LOC133474786 isoform X4 [Phyllopteryx taeniolatus]|uniref:uncharacterized protein LOC133474786 isoform X4 n=1 Tax=Phyllopteryx taeniolatus TaxID=161469 RepID=UPI002AD31234|nr:uncharacterized protein LOC133474786 isoform X4 [Phyllopteryx taeniolatus]